MHISCEDDIADKHPLTLPSSQLCEQILARNHPSLYHLSEKRRGICKKLEGPHLDAFRSGRVLDICKLEHAMALHVPLVAIDIFMNALARDRKVGK